MSRHVAHVVVHAGHLASRTSGCSAAGVAVPVVVAGGGGATPPLVGFVAGRSDRAWDAFTSCLHDLSLG